MIHMSIYIILQYFYSLSMSLFISCTYIYNILISGHVLKGYGHHVYFDLTYI